MTADWLLISCILSGVLGLILAFVLGAFWLADRADEQSEIEWERIAHHGDPCPWDLKQ